MIQFPPHSDHADHDDARRHGAGDESTPLRGPDGSLQPGLQRVDRLLAAEARQSRRLPRGVLKRLTAASRGYLPIEAAPASLPFQRAARARSRTSVWGQLAMAACIGLAFVVAGWFGHHASVTPTEDVAIHEADDVRETATVRDMRPERSPGAESLADALGTGTEWLLLGFDDDEISVLLETADMSLNDLASELATLERISNL